MPLTETVIGFDLGTKKIGIAVGQTITHTASGLETISHVENKPDWEKIKILLSEWQPYALIVGIPYNMDDSEQPLTVAARKFSRQLSGRFDLPVHLVDERLSTRASWQILHEHAAKKNYKKKRQQIDQVSATLIVETWFSTGQM
jgi:putative holliday junction resolvase